MRFQPGRIYAIPRVLLTDGPSDGLLAAVEHASRAAAAAGYPDQRPRRVPLDRNGRVPACDTCGARHAFEHQLATAADWAAWQRQMSNRAARPTAPTIDWTGFNR